MKFRDQLLVLAKRYAQARSLSMARVSTLVRNDGKFFDGLASGKDCTTGTFEYCVSWFADNWPEGTAWPEDVSCPHLGAAE